MVDILRKEYKIVKPLPKSNETNHNHKIEHKSTNEIANN